MAGSVQFSATVSVDLYNRMQNYTKKTNSGTSQIIQMAVRRFLNSEECYEIGVFLDSIDNSRLDILKDEIKKRERN